MCALWVRALGQCSNGLKQLMHSPSARALSCPQLFVHHPRALIKPHNAHTTGIMDPMSEGDDPNTKTHNNGPMSEGDDSNANTHNNGPYVRGR